MKKLLALPFKRFQPKRYRPGNLGTWSGHLPFAYDLVWALRPRVLVELGTHYGESYFGFCQAVKESGAGTQCFSVDTWQGDEHAGFYGGEVYQDVESYNQQEFASFSTLIRSTFDEACEQFVPESIDVLHIDGLHTYEAVKHDFETWFPNVRPGGVVLIHDISVRHANFEVWRWWEELSRRYPHFEFHHCWGLGVILKPGGRQQPCDLLNLLFEADGATAERIRNQFSDAADLMDFRERSPERAQAAAEANRPYLQVFFATSDAGFVESNSVLSNIEAGVSQHHVLNLPGEACGRQIRIDPVNCPALIEVEDISARTSEGDEVPLTGLHCAGQLMPIPAGTPRRYFSFGKDPQLIVDVPLNGSPLRIELRMQVRFDFEPLRDLICSLQAESAR